jgi:hypothetical protein
LVFNDFPGHASDIERNKLALTSPNWSPSGSRVTVNLVAETWE